MHHAENLRLVITNHSLSIRPVDRLQYVSIFTPLKSTKEEKKEIKKRKRKTNNRPNKPSPPILLKPLQRILRIPRALDHIRRRISLAIPAGARRRRIRRDVVEDIAQLVGCRGRGGDFELEVAAGGGGGCRRGALEDVVGVCGGG